MNKVGLAAAISAFGSAAKAKLNQGGQPEDQLRNPIEQLFTALSGECGHAAGALVLVGEKSLSELRTRPDFAAYTSELINVLNVLTLLVELEPKQADLLKRIVDGPLIPASKVVGANANSTTVVTGA